MLSSANKVAVHDLYEVFLMMAQWLKHIAELSIVMNAYKYGLY